MSGAPRRGCGRRLRRRFSEGFGPLLDSWKAMDRLRISKRMRGNLQTRLGEQAAETVQGAGWTMFSNQWMLATVASLDKPVAGK